MHSVQHLFGGTLHQYYDCAVRCEGPAVRHTGSDIDHTVLRRALAQELGCKQRRGGCPLHGAVDHQVRHHLRPGRGGLHQHLQDDPEVLGLQDLRRGHGVRGGATADRDGRQGLRGHRLRGGEDDRRGAGPAEREGLGGDVPPGGRDGHRAEQHDGRPAGAGGAEQVLAHPGVPRGDRPHRGRGDEQDDPQVRGDAASAGPRARGRGDGADLLRARVDERVGGLRGDAQAAPAPGRGRG
mmetsp:Transcript_17459/g.30657  ORF Transcript_17459/g.30657 Transcript_17459/m.30657 type:complete len:239 (+) Transcript_17459:465-1181(+)